MHCFTLNNVKKMTTVWDHLLFLNFCILLCCFLSSFVFYSHCLPLNHDGLVQDWLKIYLSVHKLKTTVFFFKSKSKLEISAHSLQHRVNSADKNNGKGLALNVNFRHLCSHWTRVLVPYIFKVH